MKQYIDEFMKNLPHKNAKDDIIPLVAAIEANHIIDKTISDGKILTTNEYFRLFSALNLMNAYVKRHYAAKEFRHNYEFKSKAVKRFVENIILDKPADIQLGGNEDCIYVKIYGVMFSFHHIGKSQLIDKQNWPNMKWSGIRLQPVAYQLFEFANKYYKSSTEQPDLSAK